jgi:glucose/mannose-6-phosphate isomerase
VDLDLDAAVSRAKATVASCVPGAAHEENPAKQLAAFVNNRVPVIYASGYLEPVARRWKTQFNENSKALAFCDVIPESNHNDLVAWSGGDRGAAARMCGLFLHRGDESQVMKARLQFVESVVGQQTEAKVSEAEGDTAFERMVHLLVLGDFASVYLAILRGVDPSPVEVIKSLKAEVGKHKLANKLDTELRAFLRKRG